MSIGSGVSIFKVEEGEVTRLTGSAIGGGTFLGLSELITGETDFSKIIELSRKGDNKKTDLLVGDIFGGSASEFNLEKNVLASSFGKVNELYLPDPSSRKFAASDCVKSLLVMICFNVSQLATLTAEKEGISNICYFGKLTVPGSYAAEYLHYATKFWKNDCSVQFNTVDAHLGALGCLV